MTTTLLRIADRVINRPLLILPDKLAIITEVLAGRIGVDGVRREFAPLEPDSAALAENALRPHGSRFVGDNIGHDEQGRRAWMPYRRTPDGTAIITITGSLVNRGAWVGANSGLTSYEGIAHQIQSAARDPKVKSIILDIESPGGEASGSFELAGLVRKVSAVKPTYAHVGGMCCSAAYALASGCRAIASIPSGLTGSIGVVLLHADYSRAIDTAGITPTLIHAGAHKTDGNAFEPLSKDVKADLQTEVDKFYSLFLGTVAAGRGSRLTADAARKTEARSYLAAEAKEIGLIDEICSFSELLAAVERRAA